MERVRRLKIAMVSDTANGAGGSGAIVSGQIFAERLRQNHDVVIVSSDLHADVKLRGVRLSFLKAIRHGEFVFGIPNRKLLRDTFAKVDIVHLHLPFWLSFVAMDEARKAGKPVVASFHVQPENMLYNINVRWPWLNRKIYQWWVKYLWNHANLVMCPTDFAVKKLQKYHLRTPIRAISNGSALHAHDFKAERDPAHEGYFLIFMLGRLTAEKEQQVLLKAVYHSKYKDRIKIVIAGKGQRANKLKRLARVLPHGAEIGFVSDERKNQLLATADLFVHCSSVELEGMAVLEAMGAGLPALIADGPETATAALALPQFKFPVGNAQVLTQKIDWLIENPDELKKAGKLYREAAEQSTIEHSVKEIEAEYLALCL